MHAVEIYASFLVIHSFYHFLVLMGNPLALSFSKQFVGEEFIVVLSTDLVRVKVTIVLGEATLVELPWLVEHFYSGVLLGLLHNVLKFL